MAATAAISELSRRSIGIPVEFEQQVFSVPELDHDHEVRLKAAAFIGAVAAEASLTPPTADETLVTRPVESLLDAIQAAANGDPTARKLVEMNVATDVVERTLKSGHVTQVELSVDEAGAIQQHGQSMDSVQANSLRYATAMPQMRERVEAETRNAFRIRQYYETGLLEDYQFVVFSRAADNMTPAELEEAGFFTDTMSCAIQLTSADGTRLVTESAFVAGCEEPGAPRHDARAIAGLLRRLGVDIEGKSAAELIDSPFLIHKSLLPDGAINLVELYDEHASGTFFGENKPPKKYRDYLQDCREREKNFQPTVQQIVADLIAEAPQITTRVMATERLHKLSERHLVKRSLVDTSINADVFGRTASYHIEMARWHAEQGNAQQAELELQDAVKTARSSSCPNGLGGRKLTEGENMANGSSEQPEASDESGDCDFISKECPLCHKKDVKTVVRKQGRKKIISGDCGCSKTVDAE